MKYLVISAVMFVACVLVLGPLAGAFQLPSGVSNIMDDLGGIF